VAIKEVLGLSHQSVWVTSSVGTYLDVRPQLPNNAAPNARNKQARHSKHKKPVESTVLT
jgi:hypothetical protein